MGIPGNARTKGGKMRCRGKPQVGLETTEMRIIISGSRKEAAKGGRAEIDSSFQTQKKKGSLR